MESFEYSGRNSLFVDLNAIYENLRYLKEVSRRQIIPVIKADGYGLGAVAIARYLEGKGIRYFAVATYEEAMELRDSGIKGKILILSGSPDDPYEKMQSLDFVPVVYSKDQLVSIKKNLKNPIAVHIKFNTGMNRLGFDEEEFKGLFSEMDGVEIEGVLTHFSKADTSKSYTEWQISRFKKILKMFKMENVKVIHSANSAGILRGFSFGNAVRPGIFLYGALPNPDFPRPLKQRIPYRFLCKILEIRKLKKGDRVSYGGTYIAGSDMKIAIVGCGYADGIPRLLSNRGSFLFEGRRLPITGRVCMDMTIIDVTSVPSLRRGDSVVYLGESGKEVIYADDVAKKVKTIGYEILTSISSRVKRKYRGDGTD